MQIFKTAKFWTHSLTLNKTVAHVASVPNNNDLLPGWYENRMSWKWGWGVYSGPNSNFWPSWDSIQVLKAKHLYPYLCESKIAGVQNAVKRSRDDCEGVLQLSAYLKYKKEQTVLNFKQWLLVRCTHTRQAEINDLYFVVGELLVNGPCPPLHLSLLSVPSDISLGVCILFNFPHIWAQWQHL